MSDDEADPEILALLREQLGIGKPAEQGVSSDTGVLRDAEYISDNSIDVSISMHGTQNAARTLYSAMRSRHYSTQSWNQHPLHPKLNQDLSAPNLVNFVWTLDLLNFSFWSELDAEARYQVEYRGERWTGYNSLVACLRRAGDEGVQFTTPRFWRGEGFEGVVGRVFRSATEEVVPLLGKRVAVLREAAGVLRERYGDGDDDGFEDGGGVDEDADDVVVGSVDLSSDGEVRDQGMSGETDHAGNGTPDDGLNNASRTGSSAKSESPERPIDIDTTIPKSNDAEMSGATEEEITTKSPDQEAPPTPLQAARPSRPDMTVVRLIEEADHSAGKLVNLLAKHFPCFRDEGRFDGRKVRFLKRAQIFVADLWAAFDGKGYGHFHDIHHLTMFADYRVPQHLYSLGVLSYSPPLESRLRRQLELEPTWEMQLRGNSIWAVELIRRQIVRDHPEAANSVNSVLLDFLLYDLAKEVESSGKSNAAAGQSEAPTPDFDI